MADRTNREAVSREKTERKAQWKAPSTLESPEAPIGYKHRWIRESVMDFDDRNNIHKKRREGYELVRADQHPDFEAPVIDSGKYEGVIGVGGLLLAKIPIETVKERNEYYQGRASDLQEAVDQDLMRENAHNSMSITKPDRQTRVQFGGPRKE